MELCKSNEKCLKILTAMLAIVCVIISITSFTQSGTSFLAFYMLGMSFIILSLSLSAHVMLKPLPNKEKFTIKSRVSMGVGVVLILLGEVYRWVFVKNITSQSSSPAKDAGLDFAKNAPPLISDVMRDKIDIK